MQLTESIDLERYMGHWYVIANMPAFLEKRCTGSIEHYDLREDGNVDITFTCYKDKVDGKKQVFTATGFVLDDTKNTQWAVQFFWPIKFSFLVLEHDQENYQWTTIGHPSKDYVWIMSRNRFMDEAILEKRIEYIQSQGYNVSKLNMVTQPMPEQVEKTMLSTLEWKNRVLVISGTNTNKVQQQHRMLSRNLKEKDERKVKILLPENLHSNDSRRLKSDSPEFELFLFGLDGELKFRSTKLVSLDEVFAQIDTMPMRQRELRKSHTNRKRGSRKSEMP